MGSPMVTINIVVFNGEKYIRHCLDSVRKQTYLHELIEINILDNNSSDRTVQIAKEFSIEDLRFKIYESDKNLGMWPGQEKLLEYSHGKYILALSVDVILDTNFIKNAVKVFEKDYKTGAIQAKVYQWQIKENKPEFTKLIDTLGFRIFRSRRLINVAQGDNDRLEFDQEGEILAVEGAVPIFRKQALEDCRLETQVGKIIDDDFFWYGDDLDLTWRMRLFDWKQLYSPKVIAYHDRQTTKDVKKHWYDHFSRIKKRRQIPIRKRRLDWANYRLARIKNDQTENISRDLPYILIREIIVLVYTLLFEPEIFLEFPRFFRLVPRMLKRRKEIMSKVKVSAKEIHKLFE